MTTTIGSGQHAIICLHGWFGHAEDWGPWIDMADADTFTWIFPEYRGYGTRLGEASGHTLDEIHDDIAPVVTDASVTYDTVTLLGHSMGGAYAQYVLSKLPDAINAFIGISPVPSSGTPLPPDQRAVFESAGTTIEARRGIIDITTGNRMSGHWLDHMAAETTKYSTKDAVAHHFKTWADCDFLESLGTQSIPALAIVGAIDPAVTADVVAATYGTTFSDLVVLEYPDAGHYSMFETPVRLATDIEAFLGERVIQG